MQNYNVKKILVPLDGSQNSLRGLEKAIYFARQCGAKITGICVAYVPPKLAFVSVKGIDSTTRKKIDTFLDKAKTISAKNGVDFEGEVVSGSAEKDILDFANKWNYDLIVIGSRGAGSTDKSYIGSIANHILHNSSIPVLVVK
ncbi:MAG: universal stress protein [Nitrosopumilus sp.]|jgi:nucleotide-binding universal stress UspA family protein|nr:universal stress protein [Nitrosopumilus sp.]MDH3502534.1 universal stress protein [Nitrosopumilus sp.]